MGEIDLVRALALGGIRCAVAAVPDDPALFARNVVGRVPWSDPWEQEEEMVDSLIEFGRRLPVPSVLYFNGDHDLALVSRHRSELGAHFHFVLAEPQLVETLLDKARFFELAERLDLPVPTTFWLDPARTPPPEDDVTFPVVVKPITRRDDVWRPVAGGGKALAVNDAASLARLWDRLGRVGTVLLQELVPGPETRVEGYHVYVDDGGATACEFTGRKLRTWPAEFGDTTALEITDAHDVRDLGREVIAKVGLRGVAKVDFKRTPDGRLRLLEINPRFNLWHHAGALAGVNIPATVYADLTGAPRPPSSRARNGVRWVHPTRDYKAARSQRRGTVRWAADALRSEGKWALSWRDPMPFVRGVVVKRVRRKLSRSGA